MTRILGCFILCCATLLVPCFAPMLSAAELSVSPDKRFLLKDGKPFFYLADTGWLALMNLNRKEADRYLEDRAAKGFTVIQTILLGIKPSEDERNAYGHQPLMDKDPTRPNELYFEHVDYVINKANSLGMFVAIAPSWSDWMYKHVRPGPHPFHAKNARSFGEYVGRRYKESDIIWLIGGDRDPAGYEDILIAMAEGLDAGDGESNFLMTFHGEKTGKRIPPENIYSERRSASAHLFGDTDWIDFHGAYSGHQWAYPTYRLIAQDRAMKPPRPVIDLEPCYENHPYIADGRSYFGNKREWDGKTRGTASLVRKQAYWAVLAGAAGHTYGCHDIWQFYDQERKAITHANTHWPAAIDFPGAAQMGILRRLIESRPWYAMVPDQSIITSEEGRGENHRQAARAADGKFLLVYLPQGGNVTVDLQKLSGSEAKAYWFNPRTGKNTYLRQLSSSGTRQFAAPSSGTDNDWVLVLDDAVQNFPTPGTPG